MNRMPRIKGKGAQQYHNAVARYNLGENIARHMRFIYSIILFDKFDLSMKKLQNFSDALLELKKRWMDDSHNDITSESLVIYCQKKKINVAGFVKSIPFSQKMFLSDIKGQRAAVGCEKNINSSFMATLYLSVPILKGKYKFSNAKIEEFFRWVEFYVDSYYRKQPGTKERYCSDEGIRQAFIEDAKIDILTGEKIA